jgi:hypothetical protein
VGQEIAAGIVSGSLPERGGIVAETLTDPALSIFDLPIHSRWIEVDETR